MNEVWEKQTGQNKEVTGLKNTVKKLYEGLFLADSAKAAENWDAVITAVENILEKAEADIVSIRKWDERKLAYEIKGKSRGTYILCYFKVNGEKIRDIERDIRLSEQILRVLILSAEHMTQEDIEKAAPATRLEKSELKTAEKVTEKTAAAIDKAEARDSQRPKLHRQRPDAETDS
jgi:small subunit ribosomal protein S6